MESDLAVFPESLRKKAANLKLAAGDTLFRRGDVPRNIYYVEDGEIRLLRYSRHGTCAVLQTVRQGFIAEASVVSPKYHCDAVADTASSIVGFRLKDMWSALDDDRAFRRAWFGYLAREIRQLRTRCERLGMPTAEERLVHFIETEGYDGGVTLNGTVKNLASLLGLSHEALYRTVGKMKRQGRLSVDGRHIMLMEAAARAEKLSSSSR